MRADLRSEPITFDVLANAIEAFAAEQATIAAEAAKHREVSK